MDVIAAKGKKSFVILIETLGSYVYMRSVNSGKDF